MEVGEREEGGGLAAIYAREGRRLLLYARALTGREDLAEEALQEAFLRLWRAPGARLSPPLLFAAVRHAALNAMRTEKREAARREAWTRDFGPLVRAPAGAEPDDLARLNAALAGLPGEQREALTLKVWGGLAFARIGEVMGTSPDTAASRVRYALEKLRAALEVAPP